VRVERGDRVLRDDVLAVIELPELDRQRQAAQADARFKRANARSAAALTDEGAIASREVQAAQASANMAEAVLAGLDAQKEYAILRAPFSGTITARHADPGALVQSAASARTGALPVVTVGQTDRLRIEAHHCDRRLAE
jgi:membrane fusion protein (multidrug efflux system)